MEWIFLEKPKAGLYLLLIRVCTFTDEVSCYEMHSKWHAQNKNILYHSKRLLCILNRPVVF